MSAASRVRSSQNTHRAGRARLPSRRLGSVGLAEVDRAKTYVDLSLVDEAGDDGVARGHEAALSALRAAWATDNWTLRRISLRTMPATHPLSAPAGMDRVPRPGLVHHATSSPSLGGQRRKEAKTCVSAMVELGCGGAQRQKSEASLMCEMMHIELELY